jgi:hypothetical protein
VAEQIETIGKKLTESAVKDAVHIAIAPVRVGDDLKPGQRARVRYIGGEARVYEAYEDDACDGIIDPYLHGPVKEGDRCWLFLMPGSITGLRHDWTHPSFASVGGAADREESERWLREYATRYEADYEGMVDGAVSGKGYCFGDDDGPPNYRGAEADFWRHIENVAGQRFSEQHREGTPFRCAC